MYSLFYFESISIFHLFNAWYTRFQFYLESLFGFLTSDINCWLSKQRGCFCRVISLLFIIPDNGRARWSLGAALHGLSVFVVLHSELPDPLNQLWAAQPGETGRSDLRLDYVTREYSAQSLLLHLQQLNEKLVRLLRKTVWSWLDMVGDRLRLLSM